MMQISDMDLAYVCRKARMVYNLEQREYLFDDITFRLLNP
jgi:hypothetical protein